MPREDGRRPYGLLVRVAVLVGVAAVAVLVHGDAPPASPETVEVLYCGSYVPLKGLALGAPLPESAVTSCSHVFVVRR